MVSVYVIDMFHTSSFFKQQDESSFVYTVIKFLKTNRIQDVI